MDTLRDSDQTAVFLECATNSSVWEAAFCAKRIFVGNRGSIVHQISIETRIGCVNELFARQHAHSVLIEVSWRTRNHCPSKLALQPESVETQSTSRFLGEQEIVGQTSIATRINCVTINELLHGNVRFLYRSRFLWPEIIVHQASIAAREQEIIVHQTQQSTQLSKTFCAQPSNQCKSPV